MGDAVFGVYARAYVLVLVSYWIATGWLERFFGVLSMEGIKFCGDGFCGFTGCFGWWLGIWWLEWFHWFWRGVGFSCLGWSVAGAYG